MSSSYSHEGFNITTWSGWFKEHKNIVATVTFGVVLTLAAWKYITKNMSGKQKSELESDDKKKNLEDITEPTSEDEVRSEHPVSDVTSSEQPESEVQTSKQPVIREVATSKQPVIREVATSKQSVKEVATIKEPESEFATSKQLESEVATSEEPESEVATSKQFESEVPNSDHSESEITSCKKPESDTDITDKIESPENSESYLTSSDDQSGEDPYLMMKRGIKVFIKRGDITAEYVDVIVNAANGRLQHGGGVARAIAVKAGRGIDIEGQKKLRERGSSLKVSEVMHTGGYNLNAEYVVHAVGPMRGRDDRFQSQLKNTFFNCLDYADRELKAKTIAIPLISSGIFGGQKLECAKALIESVNSFADDDKFMSLKEIRLVNIDSEATDAIQKVSAQLKVIKKES